MQVLCIVLLVLITISIGYICERSKGFRGTWLVDSSTFLFPTSCHPQVAVSVFASGVGKDSVNVVDLEL